MKRILLSCLVGMNAMLSLTASIIRDDVPDQNYLNLANNVGEFAAGADFPDFSPACFVQVGEGQGSGVLIAPQYVLTAAHVIWTDPDEPIPGQTDITVSFGPGPEGSFDVVRTSSAYVMHQAWVDILQSEFVTEISLFSSGIDIALIRL
ncbi:MAG: trypsin-like serine peptidase, partial [Puniceicoccales bacterium]